MLPTPPLPSLLMSNHGSALRQPGPSNRILAAKRRRLSDISLTGRGEGPAGHGAGFGGKKKKKRGGGGHTQGKHSGRPRFGEEVGGNIWGKKGGASVPAPPSYPPFYPPLLEIVWERSKDCAGYLIPL